jgi:hypothetical protein
MTGATIVESDVQPCTRGRLEKGHLRRELRSGVLTLPMVARDRPEPLRPLALFALLLELPGFGCRRLAKLNQRAIKAGVNLAVTLGDASEGTLEWVVREISGLDEITVAPIPEAGDWRALALALDDLVLDHERSVRDESLPVDRWAFADERLHQARAQLMSQVSGGSAS